MPGNPVPPGPGRARTPRSPGKGLRYTRETWANLGSLQPSALPTSESCAGIREGVLGSQLGARALPNPNIPLCTASLLLAEQGGIGVIVYDICGPAIAHSGRDAAAAEEV